MKHTPALPSRIEQNVAVNCRKPYAWRGVKEGSIRNADDGLASGRNLAYGNAPGFIDLAKWDFRLKLDSHVFKDLPGFQPIPFEKIGLYVDEFRRRLPTDAEAGRVRTGPGVTGAGYEILDRE